MKNILPIALMILFAGLVAYSTVQPSEFNAASAPDQAVQSLFGAVKNHDWKRAYSYVAPASNIDESSFISDLNGKNGSLRTYSSLQDADIKTLRQNDSEATVQATLRWSSAVGAIYETRALKVVKDGNQWKALWPIEKNPNLPPQVIPVNYLRWDVIRRGNDEDWGAQNVEAPRVRIISMSAVPYDGGTTIVGEIENEDTVPGFVSVSAILLGKDGSTLGQESSFDKTSHTLLPKEVSPYRIDFPKINLSIVKSVRMQPNALLVPASADPVIGVLHQRIEKDERGRPVLKGELMNESGETVNIPQVLATYYDKSGRVIWVSDGYVDHALLPQTPEPFAVDVRDDLASNIQTYRVTVNNYTLNKQ